MRTYNELTLEERVEIQLRLESGDSHRAVAGARSKHDQSRVPPGERQPRELQGASGAAA